MRISIALAIAIVLAACALQQSGAERSLLFGNGSRTALIQADTAAIIAGMTQARTETERFARDTHRAEPDARPPALTR